MVDVTRSRCAEAAPRTAPAWLRAFRSIDHFVMESLKDTAGFEGSLAVALAVEFRKTLVRSGAALIAASAARTADETTAALADVRERLAEASYHLNLARRFGWVSLKRYRVLISRQQGAVREVEGLIAAGAGRGAPVRSRAPG